MPHNHPGYDVRTTTAEGETSFLEVKGRIEGADTFVVTQNELRFAANVPDAYVLTLVEVSADGAEHDRVRYLARPYGPDVRLPFRYHQHDACLAGLLATSLTAIGRLMPTKLIEVALPSTSSTRKPPARRAFGTATQALCISGGHVDHSQPAAQCSSRSSWTTLPPTRSCFPREEDQERERQRLFGIIERLVPWEASDDEKVLEEARTEIRRWYPDGLPRIVDPFCGGGSIPLEAQRLGLEALASDLNPVAVLITKALIELPPKFADRSPVHPGSDTTLQMTLTWRGAQGLADDIRYYGKWMRDEAERRIGHLYPKATLSEGKQATVIAWLWARTVTCPNPACRSTMPLVSSFWLGKKKGKETWVRPIPEPSAKRVRFEIGHGSEGPPVPGTRQGRGTGFKCLVCESPTPQVYVHDEIDCGRSGVQLMAKVAAGHRTRVYLAPTEDDERAARCERPLDAPDAPARGTFGGNAQGRRYGFRTILGLLH